MSNISESIYKITANSFEKYLMLMGWKRNYDFKNHKLKVFYNAYKTIAIPASEKYEDFYDKIIVIIEELAFIYNKEYIDIIKDIVGAYHDRMEFRIVSRLSDDGKLPLGYAAKCIEGLKNLVMYAACAESNDDPEPVCLRTTNYSKSLVDNFRFDQTDKGSFVINIDIQIVPDDNEQYSLFGKPPVTPIEHKIVERISTAMHQVNEIAEKNKSVEEVVVDAYRSGITANMCDALLNLKPDKSQAEIETTFRYASVISQTVGKDERININNDHFTIIREISKLYRENEQMEYANLNGFIKALKKDGAEDNTINLITQYDSKLKVIKVKLSNYDYKIACDAHKEDKVVFVEGKLDMSKKNWFMDNVKRFGVLDN